MTFVGMIFSRYTFTMSKVRVRMAPSPTGYLHIGTARTALFNWLFAKKNKGEFILRIEDTDLERSDKIYEQDIVEGFKWLGLDLKGEIFYQSKRLDIYEEYIEKLLKSGRAFRCYHSQEELEKERGQQMVDKEAPRHICKHKLSVSASEQNGRAGIIRLAVDENSERLLTFDDQIRGRIDWEEKLLGDFSIAKDPRTPLYNLAVVVDDIDMQISHVIRGEDHISNTPKQILIYEAIAQTGKTPLKIPKFAHLPLILGSDKSKLSKRNGTTSVSEYKKDYLPGALINFMGFLGYTYSKEILSKEEMADEFELEKIHKSGAIFDIKKLNWINSQYIHALSTDKFKKMIAAKDVPEKALPMITERLEKLTDVADFDYFWKSPDYAKELLRWKKSDLETSLKTLAEVKKIIQDFDFNKDKNEFRKALDEFSKRVGDPSSPSGQDRGLVYWPLRAALTGKEKSPDPVDIVYALGKEKALERVSKAIER